jgi:hypothetical protein
VGFAVMFLVDRYQEGKDCAVVTGAGISMFLDADYRNPV